MYPVVFLFVALNAINGQNLDYLKSIYLCMQNFFVVNLFLINNLLPMNIMEQCYLISVFDSEVTGYRNIFCSRV